MIAGRVVGERRAIKADMCAEKRHVQLRMSAKSQ